MRMTESLPVQPVPLAPPLSATAGSNLTPWVVVVSYSLLITAWIFGNPPGAGPDEWFHYLRAVSMGRGQLLGTPVGLEGAKAIVGERSPSVSEQLYEMQLTWVAQNTRQVHIPNGLTPGWFRCPLINPFVSARCLNNSPPLSNAHDWPNPTATYQPFPYLVPAAVSWIKTDPDNLSRLMRLGKALFSLIFVAGAVLLLWNREAGLVSLVGLIVAMTPMVVFLSATLNPSGLEITSALAFFSALLRLRRGQTHRGPWLMLAFSGAVLALSRLTGPVWIALDLGVVVLMSGIDRLLRLAKEQWRLALAASILVASGVFLNRLWEHLYGPRMSFDLSPFPGSLLEGMAQLPVVLLHQMGMFNYLEFELPQLAYAVWAALALAVAVIAFVVGSNQERIALAVTLAVSIALPVILVAGSMRHTGFGLQGRYVLAFSIVVPLISGEILVTQYQKLKALKADHLFLPFAIGAALVQLVAWGKNAYRFAVGLTGAYWVGSSEWVPPGGWWPWLILAAAGATLLIAAVPIDWLMTRRARGMNAFSHDHARES
jgi:hypothetical protein